MISSGILLGTWDLLRLKHIEPIIGEDEEVRAAKLRVYFRDMEEYYSLLIYPKAPA
jgi:hypothetical protein